MYLSWGFSLLTVFLTGYLGFHHWARTATVSRLPLNRNRSQDVRFKASQWRTKGAVRYGFTCYEFEACMSRSCNPARKDVRLVYLFTVDLNWKIRTSGQALLRFSSQLHVVYNFFMYEAVRRGTLSTGLPWLRYCMVICLVLTFIAKSSPFSCSKKSVSAFNALKAVFNVHYNNGTVFTVWFLGSLSH